MNDNVLSTSKAAELCFVSPRTVAEWCDRGLIKHHRISRLATGGDRRVSVYDLRDFMAERSIPMHRLNEFICSNKTIIACDSDIIIDKLLSSLSKKPIIVDNAFDLGMLTIRLYPKLVVLFGRFDKFCMQVYKTLPGTEIIVSSLGAKSSKAMKLKSISFLPLEPELISRIEDTL